MKLTKKSVSVLATLALLVGGAGMLASKVHAQQTTTSPISTTSVVQTPTASEKQTIETENESESATGTNDVAGGHEDQSGANVNHQFEGVE